MTLPVPQENPQYLCPLCQQALNFADKVFRCENNHSFDQAKEGYVNLIPVQFKHSKDPGDNKAMVNARRAFLDKGFYQPLVDRITAMQQEYASTKSNSKGDNITENRAVNRAESKAVNKGRIFDAGCGEGFYTHQHSKPTNSVYGIDIAKNAVKIAAKKYKQCFFSVGTLSQLPFKAEFFNWIYSIYAPILEQEFTRVLEHGGYLLTVTPAENHLFELKSLIYRQANQHDTTKSTIQNLTLISEERLNYKMDFEHGDDIINLLAMTPFAFKTSEALIADLKSKTAFSCQADFLIRLYQK